MMTTNADWDRLKWAFLSRLPFDAPSSVEEAGRFNACNGSNNPHDRKFWVTPYPFLPFNFQTSQPTEDYPYPPNICPSDELTQEYQAIFANEQGCDSDTRAIAVANGWDDKWYRDRS